MANKSIVKQLEDCKNEIDKTDVELTQLGHQMDKEITKHNKEERKKRTRNLIEKGGLLESIHPSIKSLSKEQLKAFLQQVLLSDQALQLLSEMAEPEDTE